MGREYYYPIPTSNDGPARQTVPKLLHLDTWVFWEAQRHARQGRPKQTKMLV